MMASALGDLIGAILAEVSRGRLEGDRETARLADVYASDDLLVHMPVPRFRLPNISIDMPVVLDDVEVSSTAPRYPVVPNQTRRRQIVNDAVDASGLTLNRTEKAKVNRLIDAEATRLGNLPESSVTRREITKRLGLATASGLSDLLGTKEVEPVAVQRFADAVRRGLQEDLDVQLARTSAIRISARTQDVQMQQDPSRVFQLRLEIAEEAYELRLGADDAVEHFGPE